MNSAECIYCEGPILDSIQKSGLFEDCKTFVDMPMKYSSGKLLFFTHIDVFIVLNVYV